MDINPVTDAEMQLNLLMHRLKAFLESLEAETPGLDFQGVLALPVQPKGQEGPALTAHLFMSNVPGAVICAAASHEAAIRRARANGFTDKKINELLALGKKMGATLGDHVGDLDTKPR